MTDLRTAAQQALEALEMMQPEVQIGEGDAAIKALKKALVEDAMQKFTDVNQELEAALAEHDKNLAGFKERKANWDIRAPRSPRDLQCKLAEETQERDRQRREYEEQRLAALTEPCPCGDRPAAQCPGEWEPGCDLGNNPKYAKRVEMTPKELAASIKRGEKWKVAEPTPLEDVVTHGSAWSKNGKRIDPMSVYAEPVQEPVRLQCTTCGTVYADGVPPQVPVQEPAAQVHPNHLKPTDDGKPWCREVLLYSGDHNGDLFKGENYRVKLYTAPPQRKPLTDDAMQKVFTDSFGLCPEPGGFLFRVGRAVERAHGIGGEG